METAPAVQARTSLQAVWSLVLGILSITCLWLVGSIPAIVLGILAIKNIDASQGALEGRGKAIAGLITGGVGVVLGIMPLGMVAAISLPAFVQTRERAEQAVQVNHVRQLSMACQMYALDNEGKFPPDLAGLVPDYLDTEEILTCRVRKTGESGPYLYRPGLSDQSPPKEPLLLAPFPIKEKQVVGYVDGSVDAMPLPLPDGLTEGFR